MLNKFIISHRYRLVSFTDSLFLFFKSIPQKYPTHITSDPNISKTSIHIETIDHVLKFPSNDIIAIIYMGKDDISIVSQWTVSQWTGGLVLLDRIHCNNWAIVGEQCTNRRSNRHNLFKALYFDVQFKIKCVQHHRYEHAWHMGQSRTTGKRYTNTNKTQRLDSSWMLHTYLAYA